MAKRTNPAREQKATTYQQYEADFMRYHLAAVALGDWTPEGQKYLRKAWRVMDRLLRQRMTTVTRLVVETAKLEKLVKWRTA